MKSHGAVKVADLVPTHQNSQQAIESIEVIDMRMGYEHMFEALDLAVRQERDIAQVEENRLRFELHVDIQGRIAVSPIDELWMQDRPHADPQRMPSTLPR